jgi:hypothetical protein
MTEFVMELAERCQAPGWVAERLRIYASIDPQVMDALGAGDLEERRTG